MNVRQMIVDMVTGFASSWDSLSSSLMSIKPYIGAIKKLNNITID